MKKGSETWDRSAWRRLRESPINAYKYLKSGSQVVGPGYAQQCPVTEQGAMGTNWNTGNFI